MVRIPNETLVKSSLINLSAFPIRRIDLTLTIFQEDDLEAARVALVGLGEVDPQVLLEPEPFVQVQGFRMGLQRFRPAIGPPARLALGTHPPGHPGAGRPGHRWGTAGHPA